MKTRDSRHTEKATQPLPLRKVSIIGAGVMGRGIAEANLRAGFSVILHDSNSTASHEAVQSLRSTIQPAAVPAPHFRPVSNVPTISSARSDEEIANVDLVIEAVPEDAKLKAKILARIEPFLPPHALVASNSSSIPITQLATSLADPSRMCGLHFCHPISQRPLVEVIRTGLNSPETIQRAFDYAQSLGMAPLVVSDRPGFLLNRLLMPYMNESLELILEGVPAEMLDQAAFDFGMPMGPLKHFDEFGIDVALAVGRNLYLAFPDRIVPSELLIAMYKARRFGCKSKTGFYSANESSNKQLAPQVLRMIEERRRSNSSPSSEVVARRLFLPMLLEAMRGLEESVVNLPANIDQALRDGLGMTSAYRGLFTWADSVGARQILNWLESLTCLGKHFEPTPRLHKLAARNAGFFD